MQCYVFVGHLVSHTRAHSRERSFMCDMCPKAFLGKGNLIRHVRKYHPDPDPLTIVHTTENRGTYNGSVSTIQHTTSLTSASTGSQLTNITQGVRTVPITIISTDDNSETVELEATDQLFVDHIQ